MVNVLISISEDDLKKIDQHVSRIGFGATRSGLIREIAVAVAEDKHLHLKDEYITKIQKLGEKRQLTVNQWLNEAVEKQLKIEFGFSYFR
jgi:hypothetical protein